MLAGLTTLAISMFAFVAIQLPPVLKIGTELIVGNDRMAIQKALNPDYCRGRNDC